MASAMTAPTFLTIPCELRNAIYQHIFSRETQHASQSPYDEPSNGLAAALKLQSSQTSTSDYDQCSITHLRVLQTCKQIHHEAHLLALATTGFYVSGESAHPECFATRISPLRDSKICAIRHITLTARVSHMRALNESWQSWAFGNPRLELDTLTLIPTKPDAAKTIFSEIADQSQSHTLGYVFAESFKCLRNVRLIHVKNQDCFNSLVWRIVYRSMVYRLWRWGGNKCGVRFQSCDDDEEEGKEWFKVWLKDDGEGSECGDEVLRLVGAGGELPDPSLINV